MKKFILISFLFLVLCSCTGRKSSRQGEAMLAKMEYVPDSTVIKMEYMKALLDVGEKYDFTTEQLIRLKCLQLTRLGAIMTEKERLILYNEIEGLTKQTGNDSLVMKCNSLIFNYLSTRDSDTALVVARFNRDVPLLIKKQKGGMLGGYYGGMSMFYRRIFKYEKAAEYALQLRPYALNLLMWYVAIGGDMLEAKHYSQAVLYADSALALAAKNVVEPGNLIAIQQKLFGERFASVLKGNALLGMGKKDQALAFYEKAEKAVEISRTNFRKIQEKRGKKAMLGDKYSEKDRSILYDYACLLKRMGHTQEAVSVFNKIAHIIMYDSPTVTLKQASTEITLQVPHLLSECYALLGDQEQATYYALRADSLEIEAKSRMREIYASNRARELKNMQLYDQLLKNRLEKKNAAIVQYMLAAVIVLLVASIIAGWVWWKRRNRRIQTLFEQILYRHAMWTQLQLSVGNPVEQEPVLTYEALSGYKKEAADNEKSITIEEKGDKEEHHGKEDQDIPLHYPLVYRRLNHIMKEKELFLDPNFELATMSHEAGISRTIISNVLNRHAGMSFHDWLSEYRINYLLQQIHLNPGLELNELYPKAGYTSRATFFRQFRNVTGLTPLQYMSKIEYNDAG